jgi:hypothetical protein
MRLRVLDLDGSLCLQQEFLAQCRPRIFTAREWGPSIRLACSFGRFRRFERHLAVLFESTQDTQPTATFYGSGDFHHVSLSLVRRLPVPVNLVVFDNHPDWMRGVPFLHCGTWLYHAAQLPCVQRVFHVGGDVDFDNSYRWMAPWRLLRSRKIIVWPGIRRFQRGAWSAVENTPIRPERDTLASHERIETLLAPFRTELASRPLYVSVDKDVLWAKEAAVNWDSGHLTSPEIRSLLQAFLDAAGGNLAGLDVAGDWSPVQLCGGLRHLMHQTEHPALALNPIEATRTNEQTNRALLEVLLSRVKPSHVGMGRHESRTAHNLRRSDFSGGV